MNAVLATPARRATAWVVGLVAAVWVASLALSSVGAFPASLDIGLAEPINDARSWLIDNQRTHWLYGLLLNPIADTVDGAIAGLEAVLGWFPWFAYPIWAGIGLWWTRGRSAGALAVVGALYFGIVEVWDEGLETLALMSVAVIVAVAIGVPVGIASSRSERVAAVTRAVLDAMQTMPGFVYLIPFVLLFGIGLAPALVATLIFAMPPIVRATDLGIRNLPGGVLEAADMFGATERQSLLKVRLPLARPAILVGANQSINLALSMVVIAALIGAGGLGNLVLRSLRNLAVGEAAEAGLAIVAMAILLDRFMAGLAETTSRHDTTLVRMAAIAAVPITLLGGALGLTAFPTALSWHFAPAIDDAVGWAQVNLFDIADSGIGTGPFSDFLTTAFITPLRELLSEDIPWPVMLGLVAVVGFALRGWRLGLGAVAAFAGIGLLGMWELSMDTLAQCLIAVAVTLALGVPIGVLTARSDRVRAVVRPFLDFLQTIPSFVLLVPVIMLFNIGRVPGILASVLYALPAAVHFTDLGLRSVPEAAREAAVSFGADGRQRLAKVELPLAAPQIMIAVNQVIMLVLAMVVIAGLVGGGGLGLETVRALRRSDSVGTGFEAGIAIVLLAGVLDRGTRAFADRLRPPAGNS
ncbi:MAG: ABC transporter permease subunit [Actinomycetota bacterium]